MNKAVALSSDKMLELKLQKLKEKTMTKTLIQKAADKQFQLHQSAYTRGLEFDLSLSDVKALITRRKCFYTGVELTNADNSGHKKQTDRTIDRIDSGKGYVKGNVVACSAFANQMKERWIEGNYAFGLESLVQFTDKMKELSCD